MIGNKRLGEGATHGPWIVEQSLTGFIVTHSDGELRSHIATCEDFRLCPEHGTTADNAKLIAKAPLLVNARDLIQEMLNELIAWRHHYHSSKEGPETNLDQTGTCIAAHVLLRELNK